MSSQLDHSNPALDGEYTAVLNIKKEIRSITLTNVAFNVNKIKGSNVVDDNKTKIQYALEDLVNFNPDKYYVTKIDVSLHPTTVGQPANVILCDIEFRVIVLKTDDSDNISRILEGILRELI